jgi:hypothetical protein
MRQPAPQLAALQTSPVAQVVPSGKPLHALVLTPGWQLWHAFVGLRAPVVYVVTEITH